MPSGSRNSGRKCCAMSSLTNGAIQPFFFQVMKCEASELLMISAARMLEANSCVDPLEQPLRAGTLDLHLDARIFRLERLAELLADRKIHRGIQHHLGFLGGGLDQRRRDRRRRRRRGADGRGEHGPERQRGRALHEPLRMSRLENSRCFHRVLAFVIIGSARGSARGGSVSQTSVPLGTAFSVGVTTRNVVPSACLDHVVAAGAEKDLPRHRGLDRILPALAALRRKLDVVLADRDRRALAGVELGAHHLQGGAGKRDVIGVAGGALDHIAGADEARDEFGFAAARRYPQACRAGRSCRHSSPRSDRRWSSPPTGRG